MVFLSGATGKKFDQASLYPRKRRGILLHPTTPRVYTGRTSLAKGYCDCMATKIGDSVGFLEESGR